MRRRGAECIGRLQRMAAALHALTASVATADVHIKPPDHDARDG